MRTLLSFAAVAVICCAALLAFFASSASPTTVEIDADISRVRTEIASAEVDRASYGSGLIAVLVDARLQVLRTNVSFLQAKRDAILRRVDLRYVVNGAERVADSQRVAALEADINSTSLAVAKSRLEAERYSGGLVQVLSLAQVATDELTLAQLQMALMAERYGFLFQMPISESDTSSTTPLGQTIVTDDGEAL